MSEGIRSRTRRARVALACALPAAALGAMGAMLGAAISCANDPCSNRVTRFEVFEPASPVSEVPLCTDDDDGGKSPQYPYYSYNSPPLQIDGATGYPFPGSPPISVKGLEQCAAICRPALATYPIPCCQSQWLPRTIVCAPPCVP